VLRDGSFCAYALDRHGRHRPAAAQHTATVAAVLAGLSAARGILGDAPPVPDWPLSIVDGSLVKYAGSTQVDGSLLWVALPFGVLSVGDPVMKATVTRIETELVGPGGWAGTVRPAVTWTRRGGPVPGSRRRPRGSTNVAVPAPPRVTNRSGSGSPERSP
jgi:hypothetical protein